MVGFSDAAMKDVTTLFGRYPKKVHALLPLLHLVQRENAGFIPREWDAYVADLCECTVNHVRGVITFYNMFRTSAPGKHHIMVCTCVPCGLCGGDKLLEHLEHKLGIHAGQTTDDGMFSIEEAQCLAACDKAPLMVVNEGVPMAHVSHDQVDAWIDEARKKKA
jgi:NADH-quinone oxidoreductase subunit E